MGPGFILLFVVVAVFVMASVPHLLIWVRNTAAREHFWFGFGCLAAGGAAAAYCMVFRGATAYTLLAATQVSSAFCTFWLITATWFTVEYSGSGTTRRWIAALVTLAFVSLLLGNLVLPATTPSQATTLTTVLGLLNGAALVTLFGLMQEGSLRLWRAGRRLSAMTLGTGMGSVLLAMAFHDVLLEQELVRLAAPIPYALLIVVPLMTYELAGTVAEASAASQHQRQQFAHASRLSIVGELTASIAHEINQPLGAILSNVDAADILMESADPSLDEIRQILSDVHRDAMRASDVIRSVRALARKRELQVETLDANVVAAEVITLLEPEARSRHLVLASELSDQQVFLRGDRALLQQLLMNLISNAMDAVEPVKGGGSVPTASSVIMLRVSVTTHDEIEFQLADAGKGIPQEHIEHLFDSFYTSKPHGMGIGLAMARSIVEAHGGRVQAENNRNGGATFRVTLPPLVEPAHDASRLQRIWRHRGMLERGLEPEGS